MLIEGLNIQAMKNGNFSGILRERSFLMLGTRAEPKCPEYEKCSRWNPGIWNP